MPDYSSFKPTSDGDGRDYVQKWPAFVDQVGEDLDGKAPANHDHDGGSGATIAIGGTSARPAVCDGFVFVATPIPGALRFLPLTAACCWISFQCRGSLPVCRSAAAALTN